MIAFVFPGQGSQSLGMLADLAAAHPQVGEAFAEASDGAGVDLWALSQQGPEEQLFQHQNTIIRSAGGLSIRSSRARPAGRRSHIA